MRPDKHKKKRSAQYNKKKGKQDGKKGSQTETAGKTGSEKDLPERGKAASSTTSQQQQQRPVVNGKLDSSDSSPDDQSPGREEKRQTFQRRKIVNNWDRYDDAALARECADSESDTEDIPSASKDNSRLLRRSTAGATRDRKDSDLSTDGESESSPDEQLGIPPKLFPLSEGRRKAVQEKDSKHNLNGTELNIKKSPSKNITKVNEIRTENTGSFVIPVSQEEDLEFLLSLGTKDKTTTTNHGSKRNESPCYQTPLPTCNSLEVSRCYKTNSTIDSFAQSKFKVNEAELNIKKSPLKNETAQSLKNVENIAVNEIGMKNSGSVMNITASDEDDLDFLLSLGAKGTTTTTTNLESRSNESACNETRTLPDSHGNNELVQKTADKEETITSKQAGKTVSICDRSKVEVEEKKSKSEDLEDWLDNFLDD